jgi:DNA-binding response OmpR family regulator
MTDLTDAPVALVADDDAVIRLLLKMLLESAGFDVVVAEDGLAAVRLASNSPPQVALLDARMPALDGFQVCRAIREQGSATSRPFVIMLTASGQESDRRRAVGAGADEFLTKPFSPAKLAIRLRELRSTTVL